jgi:hypothetical protein
MWDTNLSVQWLAKWLQPPTLSGLWRPYTPVKKYAQHSRPSYTGGGSIRVDPEGSPLVNRSPRFFVLKLKEPPAEVLDPSPTCI